MKQLIGLLFVLVMAFSIASCESEPTKFSGTWRLAKYSSTQKIEEDKQAEFNDQIEALKRRLVFVLKDDHTFSRDGMAAKTETGSWETNRTEKLLILKPKGAAENKLAVDLINEKSMVLSVEDDGYRVTLTFVKQEYYVAK